MLLELSEQQTRQFIDAEAAFTALEQARKEAAQVRGSMFWREQGGGRYLIRTSPTGGQKSLGLYSDETAKIAERFLTRKEELQRRVKSLTESVETHRRLNRALRVGRAPALLVELLNAIERAGLAEHFIVVGTHALYAYESAAGVRIPDGAMATQDVDLLMDTRKGVKLFTQMGRIDSSMIGLLQKVDKTFRVRGAQKYTAVNGSGFEVDIIRRASGGKDPHPLRLSDDEDDLWAVQVPSGESLLGARRFSQVVVSSTGTMARMNTVHPLDFARIKHKLSTAVERDPLKARKDALQAQVATEIVDRYLPHMQGQGPEHDEPVASLGEKLRGGS